MDATPDTGYFMARPALRIQEENWVLPSLFRKHRVSRGLGPWKDWTSELGSILREIQGQNFDQNFHLSHILSHLAPRIWAVVNLSSVPFLQLEGVRERSAYRWCAYPSRADVHCPGRRCETNHGGGPASHRLIFFLNCKSSQFCGKNITSTWGL